MVKSPVTIKEPIMWDCRYWPCRETCMEAARSHSRGGLFGCSIMSKIKFYIYSISVITGLILIGVIYFKTDSRGIANPQIIDSTFTTDQASIGATSSPSTTISTTKNSVPSVVITASSSTKSSQESKPVQKNKTVVATSSPDSSTKQDPVITPTEIKTTKIYSVDEVYTQWKPYIANVQCTLIKNGLTYKGSGTGLLINDKDGPSILMTRHGFQDQTGGVWGNLSEYCNVVFPDSEISFMVNNQNFKTDDSEIDVGHLLIPGQDSRIQTLLSSASSLESCQAISDATPVMIIGFPNDTLTSKASYITGEITGSMNGYTGGEYVEAEAPSKAGYSGGATISMKDDCYVGMNTFTPADDLTKTMSLRISLEGLLKYDK